MLPNSRLSKTLALATPRKTGGAVSWSDKSRIFGTVSRIAGGNSRQSRFESTRRKNLNNTGREKKTSNPSPDKRKRTMSIQTKEVWTEEWISSIKMNLLRWKTNLRQVHIPEADHLLSIKPSSGDKTKLSKELSEMKHHLLDLKTKIKEGFAEWETAIDRYEDKERIRQAVEDYFQHRFHGTKESPGSIYDVEDDTGDLVLKIERKINRIRNPVVVPPFPVPIAGHQVLQGVIFLQPSTTKTERRTRESFSCTGRIPVISPKTPEENPEILEEDSRIRELSKRDTRVKESPFISPGRVLTEMEKTGKDKGIVGDSSTMPISEGRTTSQTNGISEEKFRKENLNPGEDKSVVDYNDQSSVKVGGKVQRVRIALPQNSRKKRRIHLKSRTNSTRYRKFGSRSPRHRKPRSPTFRRRKSVSRLPSPHRAIINSEEKKKKENLDPGVPSPFEVLKNKKENLDPGIRTRNGHASLFRPGMSWIMPNHENRREDVIE